MRTIRFGFTLIELLIVIVIVGILASVAIPKYQAIRGRTFAATLRADLRNLGVAEEGYLAQSTGNYSSSLTDLQFRPSPGVTITIKEASDKGWSASASHPAAAPGTCAIFHGNAAPVTPATTDGIIACQ